MEKGILFGLLNVMVASTSVVSGPEATTFCELICRELQPAGLFMLNPVKYTPGVSMTAWVAVTSSPVFIWPAVVQLAEAMLVNTKGQTTQIRTTSHFFIFPPHLDSNKQSINFGFSAKTKLKHKEVQTCLIILLKKTPKIK